MTLEELETLAKEAIASWQEPESKPGFIVVVPGLKYGRTCRLLPGLSGANLGHYLVDDRTTTRVFLRSDQVLRFVETHKGGDRP